TTKAQTAVTGEMTVDAWPTLGITWAAGDSEHVRLTPDIRARGPERRRFASVTGSAYYHGNRWEITASSTYTQSRDRVRDDDEATSLYHDLTLSIQPVDAVTVMPALSIGQDRYDTSRARSDMTAAALTLFYDPPRSRWHAWTVGAHTKAQSNDASVDGKSLSVSGRLSYALGKILGGRSSVSLESGYD